MRGGTITLLRIRGIRIVVDWSWFLVLFLVIFWLADYYGSLLNESGSATTPYLLAVLSAIGFFGSIVLHELGHAVVALRNGIGISSIRLWIFGGMANMDRESDGPGTEFKVAVGGPVVTALIVVACVVGGVLGAGSTDFRDAMELRSSADTNGLLAVVAWLATINFLVLVFNLLPAFPMDGGRIIRAIAWKITGKRSAATRFAATLGRIFGYLFIGLGIYLAFTGRPFSGIWLALIGLLISGSARAATAQNSVTGKLEGVRVADVMDTQPVAIPDRISIAEALESFFLRYQWSWFPVVDGEGRFRGLMVRDQADAVDEVARASTTVADCLERDRGELHVDEDAGLETLLGNSNLRRFGALMAVDSEGRLRGVITIEQLGRALRDGA